MDKSTKDILDHFGKLLMSEVRDPACAIVDNVIEGKARGEIWKQLTKDIQNLKLKATRPKPQYHCRLKRLTKRFSSFSLSWTPTISAFSSRTRKKKEICTTSAKLAMALRVSPSQKTGGLRVLISTNPTILNRVEYAQCRRPQNRSSN